MSFDDAKKKAFRCLEKRDYGRDEMARKLREKGESEADSAAAADYLVELGLIDDKRYAAQVVRHYAAKGCGAGRIKGELARRSLPRELWDEALEELPASDETIDRLLRARLRGDFDQKAVKRASDALLRRGFSWEEIRAALARAKAEIED